MVKTLFGRFKLLFANSRILVLVIVLSISNMIVFTSPQPTPESSITHASTSAFGSTYWLKLAGISPHSNMTIYMGFASPNSTLLNGVNVGEAPQLSPAYGRYDDGAHVFGYYTNFTQPTGWVTDNANVFYGKGLGTSFSGFGYVVTSSKFAPGTAFMAYMTSIGDTDNVGYFDTNTSLNGGTSWAGAFIRLACGSTYPDQWNASGEANGCGSAYGQFMNTEGVPGIYYVGIINSTSSYQSFNGIFGRIIDTNYPSYPASVGFSGQGSIAAQWAAIMALPPHGVMPRTTVGSVQPSSVASGISIPSDVLYYVPITITNDQSEKTQDPYQQMLVVNSSVYAKYEASNLQNVEFFYANGTVIPSWLQSGNSNTSGIVTRLIIKVNPAENTTLTINGQMEYPNSSGYLVLNDALPGKYSIFAENPFYDWFFNVYNVSMGTNYINITLRAPQKYAGEGAQYPWVQIGPAYISNPFNVQGSVYSNASGHIGLIQIDPKNADTIYIASGFASDGIMGPVADGGVYITYNGGRTWQPRDFGLPYGPISALYMDPTNTSILLVAVSNHGIYRTIDGGLRWYQVSNITGVNDFKGGNNYVFAGSNSGLVKSEDDGQTWKIIYPSEYFTGPISLSGNTIYAMVWGPAAPGNGLSYIYFIRSTDMGNSWTTLHTYIGNYPIFISASPFNSSKLYLDYAYPNDNNILYSADGGLTFVNLSIGPLKDIVFDPDNSSILWGYGPGRFIYSFDGGNSFTVGEPATDQMGMDVYPGNGSLLVLGSDQGLYLSKDWGVTWMSVSGDLSDTLTYSVSVGGKGSAIGVGMQDYSAFISLDNGKTWIGGNTPPIPVGGESTDVVVNPANSSWMYASSWSAGLAVSNNGGMNFQNMVQGSTSNLSTPEATYVDPYNESLVYFAYVNGIYNGTGYGAKWTLWSHSPTDATTVAMTSDHTFVAGTTNGVFYNTNGSWVRSGGIDGYVTSFAVDPVNASVLLAATGMFSQGSLYISYDSGRTFELLNQSLATWQNGLVPIPLMVYWLNTTDHPILATTVNNGVLLSLDQAKSWVPINFNLMSGEVTDAYYYDGDLYISTYGEGVLAWRNFSVSDVPATVNGFIGVSGATVSVNGSQVPVYGGYWQEFLKPGTYVITVSAPGLNKTYMLNLSSMQTIDINAGTAPQFINVTFTESGLPTGTYWSITMDNTTKYGTNNITFTVPAGTYQYSVGPVKGYIVSTSYGSITAAYYNITQPLTFTAISPPTKATSPSDFILLAIIALTAAVIMIAAILVLRKREK